jgi:predicted nucleic acid-binding protein
MNMAVYFDTSIFLEMGKRISKYKKELKLLLQDLGERKIRIYTSALTVQEVSVAAHRKGAIPRDTIADVKSIARIYTLTKEVALTAAKREAELKDIAEEEESKRDPSKPLTEQQKIDRICENRRRKWDCFHIATAQKLGCDTLYSTDGGMIKRKKQMNLKDLDIIPPPEGLRTVRGPLLIGVLDEPKKRTSKGRK